MVKMRMEKVPSRISMGSIQGGIGQHDDIVQPLAAQVHGKIIEIDGLRGIAILLVLIHHFWPSGGSEFVQRLAHLGWIGVDLFFVISGFLIAGILVDTRFDKHYFRNFYARRSLRIFPLYYLFLTIMFLAIPLSQGGRYGDTEFIRESGNPLWYFLYAGNIREAIIGKEPAYFLAVLWSLSIEEQFYVVFPTLVALCSLRRLTQILCSMIVFAPLFRFAMMLAFPANERIQYLATFSRVDVISLGCLLAIMFRTGAIRIRKHSAFFLCAVLTIISAIAFITYGLDRMRPFCRVFGYSLIAFTFASWVLWTLLCRGTTVTAALRFRPLCYLGKICYGIYLLQRPCEVFLVKILKHMRINADPSSFSLMVAKIAVTIGVATLSWYLFETQILRLKRFFSSRHHPELETSRASATGV